MIKFFLGFLVLLLITHHSLLITLVQARTTPEDIINAQRQTFTQKLSRYSLSNQQKIKDADAKIAQFNAEKTTLLEDNMIRQGEILDEYARRKNITIAPETDGIHRRDNPFENARYWLTYAHEAVAYQAAHIYVFNLTSESNTKGDINSQINALQSDLNILRGKVAKSQKIIADLVK